MAVPMCMSRVSRNTNRVRETVDGMQTANFERDHRAPTTSTNNTHAQTTTNKVKELRQTVRVTGVTDTTRTVCGDCIKTKREKR